MIIKKKIYKWAGKFKIGRKFSTPSGNFFIIEKFNFFCVRPGEIKNDLVFSLTGSNNDRVGHFNVHKFNYHCFSFL